VLKNKRTFNLLVVLVFVQALSASAATVRYGRYVAALSDGRMVSGDKLTGWHEIGGTVRLDGKVISAPGKPLLWMRDTVLKPWSATGAGKSEAQRGGYVEFVGGDRIVGVVVGARRERHRGMLYTPPHLLVKADMSKRPRHSPEHPEKYVRILPGGIKRIVLKMGDLQQYQPGKVIYKGGRREGFTDVRWGSDSVSLLLKRGVRTVKLADIAEIHMPRIDPWEAHYRQLALLSPGLRARLVRLETADGLIATASRTRMVATPFASERAEQRVASHREHLGRQIESLIAREPRSRETMDKAQAQYDKIVSGYDAIVKKNRDACDKARTELRPSLEKQQRDNAAEFAARRKKLTQTYHSDLKEIDKRLAGIPADKRDARRKTDIDAMNRSHQKALASLDADERKAEDKRVEAIGRLDAELAGRQKGIERARLKLATEEERWLRAVERRRRDISDMELRKEMHAGAAGAMGSPETWDHMIQPGWSLDPLWVDFKIIRMRWSFAPTEFPLSRMAPVDAVTPVLLPWRADRNASGGLLYSGGKMYAWGFGVHAFSELIFAIPPTASSFQSHLGLDSIANTGGCVRARVYLGSTENKPAYESPLMIGSARTIDTGVIRIPVSSKAGGKLILQADPAARNHPPQADPLNIRDKFDWLDPQLTFDRGRLFGRVARHIGSRANVWREWTPGLDKRGDYQWGSFRDLACGDGPERFLPAIAARGKPLTLSREMTIGGGDKWLVVDAGYTDGSRQDPKSVTLRIGDEEIASEKIPIRQYWRRAAPFVFSIEKYRRKKVKIVLTQRPDGKRMYWRDIRTTNREPDAYRLVMSLEAMGKKDMQVSRGLGLAMQRRGGKSDRLTAAIEIERKGGVANYYHQLHSYYYRWPVGRDLNGVTIGPGWTGGDKTFLELQHLPWLRYVIVSGDSGVSKKAVGSLHKIKMSGGRRGFRLHRTERMPSARFGIRRRITMRNRRAEDVAVFKVDWSGRLMASHGIKPGGEVEIETAEGFRYEAHQTRMYYRKSKPIAKCVVKGDTVWEIK
jgi:hypothetical protein